MLVLSRKVGESIVLDGGIRVTITHVQGNRVRVGIEAPGEVSIRRAELAEFSDDPKQAARESSRAMKAANSSQSDQRASSLRDRVAQLRRFAVA